MKYELFIARRIATSKKKEAIVSRPIIRLALIGVALGFAAMVIAVSIVTGFKKEIRDKVIGFGSHIQISNYDENNSFESKPVENKKSLFLSLTDLKSVAHIQSFATKAGIIKAGNEIEGIVAKGLDSSFDWNFFSNNLIAGKIFHIQTGKVSDEIIISQNVARKLSLHAGDNLIMHFIQQPPRARKFHISGIYNTGFEEFDNLYLFCDLAQIRKLNDWSPTQVGGFEITVRDFTQVDEVAEEVYNITGPDLNVRTIREVYPQIFDWLGLQNINAIIIITLMIVVSGMNMISALLIIILERINMIGIMKSMGSPNVSVRKIFLYLAANLLRKGLFWGNIIGVGFIFIQHQFGILKLDQQSYYLSYVPVNFSLLHLFLLNAGTVAVCLLMMILPTIIITRINPVSAIRYT